jgi:GT2 family glycosyltransferase
MSEIEMNGSFPLRTQEPVCVPSVEACGQRPQVRGKFLYSGEEKWWVRGVTYGTFCPDVAGHAYPCPEVVERDFTQMAENGLNTVRVYTVPPHWLLNTAQQHGLRVMVGLPWEQHIAFLDDKTRARSIETRLRHGVQACAGHPAVLCYAIGNEIPAPIVRWYGHQRIERFLERLYTAVKAEDPDGLVTYVNYPTTEYLRLPFLDLVCFNVYLETQERLAAYLARLQNLTGDRPLIMSEIGLDSRRHGEETQAYVLDWQVRTAFAAGCAGACVFAWTDEWHRGGYEIEDWDFGLTQRDRRPKPALAAVRNAFAEVPFPKDWHWPRISVVVCSYNGARTIRDCFEGLLQLEYPNFEVIVVNDGSTDTTAAITQEYGFRLISTENRGLSNARNTGLQAAKGEIVAYIDDDAYPDPHWLTYLAATFLSTTHVGVGGPNLAPPGDGAIAECVANAPGGPVHVLLTDCEAEHIPGCNMAFRTSALRAIGGFDAQFRTAGDDVDVCWRLQQRGWTLGFSPAAMVWHHRRNSLRAYWKQQIGYGRAEALLEKKWPEKYNGVGHLAWHGRLYGKGLTPMLKWCRERIYQGTWGSALFQSIYEPAPATLCSLPLMPEWYLIIGLLALLSALGIFWTPLLLALPLLMGAIGALLAQASIGAARAIFAHPPQARRTLLMLRCLTVLLHLLQPLARLRGRLRHGLTPWRRRGRQGFVWPWLHIATIWSERGWSSAEWLQSLEATLQADNAAVRRGGNYDRWDLEVRGGLCGMARTLMTIEEHGAGKQFVRFRVWPYSTVQGWMLLLLFAALSTGAAMDHAWTSAAILGVVAVFLAVRTLLECAGAMAVLLGALKRLEADTP